MSKSATATWLVSEAVTSAFSRACSRRSPSGRPVRASKWSRHAALLPLVLQRPCAAAPISARAPASSPAVSARRTRRSARTEPTCQSKGRSQEVGGARVQGGLGLALAGAEGEEGHARREALLAEDLAEAAAAVVAECHVGEHDVRAARGRTARGRAAASVGGRPPRTPRWPASGRRSSAVELSARPTRSDAPPVRSAPATGRVASASNVGIAGSATVRLGSDW